MFKNSGFIYSPKDIDFICDNILKNVKLVSKRDVKYFNIPSCVYEYAFNSGNMMKVSYYLIALVLAFLF